MSKVPPHHPSQAQGQPMTLCADGPHRWDAQRMLAKGGIEPGDWCDCGQVAFGEADAMRMLREEVATLRANVETLGRAFATVKADLVHRSVLVDFAAALLDILEEMGPSSTDRVHSLAYQRHAHVIEHARRLWNERTSGGLPL